MIINYTRTQSKADPLPDDKMRDIRMFLQGAVYSWCKNVKDARNNQRWFAARDLVGGENAVRRDSVGACLFLDR